MDKNKNERTIEYLEDSSALVGRRRRELVDRNTGEVLEVEQTTRLVYGSKSFWKCYLKELVAVLRSLSSKIRLHCSFPLSDNSSPLPPDKETQSLTQQAN